MTPEETKDFKDGVDATLALLMDFRRALDGLGRVETEPDVLCSHCGQVFDTMTKVMKHGRVCTKNPLVKEIERLQKLVKRAYREGGELAFKDRMFDEDNYCWDHSKAREALETNP